MNQKTIASRHFLLLWAFQLFQHSNWKFVYSLKKTRVSALSAWSGLPGSDEDFGRSFSRVLAAVPWSSAILHLSVPLLFHRCFLKHHPQMTTIHGVYNWTCQEEWQDLCFYISTSYKHPGGRVCSWLHLNPGAGDWGLCCSQDQSSVVSRGKRMKCKSLRLCTALENPCWPHEPLVQLIEPLFTIQTPSALTKIRSANLQVWPQSLGSSRSRWVCLVITMNYFPLSVMPVLASGHPSWCPSSSCGCSPIFVDRQNGNSPYKADE